MKTKSFLVCFIVIMLATSVAMAGGATEISAAGSLAAAHSTAATGIIIATAVALVLFSQAAFGFPYFGYPYGYGYYPYNYGYYPYGYGYGSGYYGYGAGYYGNSYYGNRYYGSNYYRGYGYNGYQSRVARLQQQLARAGYYRGSIDGIMGPRTRYARCAPTSTITERLAYNIKVDQPPAREDFRSSVDRSVAFSNRPPTSDL